MASLPSPPPNHTLPYTSLPLDTVEALRSSCAQLLVAIEEIQGMINWGGEAGIVGWPSLLAAYQRLMSLLALLNHHMTTRSIPASQANSFGSRSGGKPTLTLSQHAVHPHIPSEPSSEAWIQALLSTHAAVMHEPPPDPPVGDAPAHEARRQRALRVCTALAGLHDWKGRVGLVGDGEPDSGAADELAGAEDDNDEAGMDEDEDMFGSGDEADPVPPNSEQTLGGDRNGGPRAEAPVPTLGKVAKEQELRRLLALMARGESPS